MGGTRKVLKDQSKDEDVINAQGDLDQVAREKFQARLRPQRLRFIAANPSQINTQAEKQSERHAKRRGLNSLAKFYLVSLALEEPKVHGKEHDDDKQEKGPPIPIHVRCAISGLSKRPRFAALDFPLSRTVCFQISPTGAKSLRTALWSKILMTNNHDKGAYVVHAPIKGKGERRFFNNELEQQQEPVRQNSALELSSIPLGFVKETTGEDD